MLVRDAGTHQSVRRNITGKPVKTGHYIFCQVGEGNISEEYRDYVSFTLCCLLVEETTEVAVLDKLPVE